jgi:type IV pilus assembly protein PilC
MLFKYKVIDEKGLEKEGTIDAVSEDVAITSLQGRKFVVSYVKHVDDKPFFKKRITLFGAVKSKEIVILSRQISTLFEAQVSALRVFKLLAAEVENEDLKTVLSEIGDDLQGGNTISKALSKHPSVFSNFYVNMVMAGEESGKLDEVFIYLADYLDRNEQVTSKAKNALVYPAFVIFTFIVVMVLMFTMVIPKISEILLDAGQEIPIYTRIVIGISDLLVNYGAFVAILVVIGGFFLFRFMKTDNGKRYLSSVQLSIPFIGTLYRKLYLSRISDNMDTMLASGISMVRALEVTSSVVDNVIYKEILERSIEMVKSGSTVSNSLNGNDEIPNIMVQMIKVGEETGNIGEILKTLSKFYRREVNSAVDTMVDLIEPIMIVLLGLGVGFILASVLIPIYNISSAI